MTTILKISVAMALPTVIGLLIRLNPSSTKPIALALIVKIPF